MTARPALGVEDLRFAYRRGADVVDVPRLELDPGVHHVVGLNGSGKSTFLKLLAGLLRPRAGRVHHRGGAIDTPEGFRTYCRASGYLWQNFQLKGSTSAHAYLSYRAWLHGVPATDAAATASRALALVGMHADRDTSVGRLSGGSQRRIGIAAETLHAPDVLLLDEPGSGLDYRAAELVYAAVDALVAADATVVTVTHEPEVLARHRSTVHVMSQGRLTTAGRFERGEITGAVLRDLVEQAQ